MALDSNLYQLNRAIVDTVKGAIDIIYSKDPYARFYVLETVARVPYFAYLSVMHLKETFGSREAGLSERMRIHYAEADNELHHLLIMEALGGNSSGIDRTVAQTMAFGYYWYVVLVYTLSEPAAYHLSELIEDHAYITYDKFIAENEEELKQKPVPDIARKYYEEDNPFLYNLMYTASGEKEGVVFEGQPRLQNLYDVFVCVRNDEKSHWETLCNLVQSGNIASKTGAPAQPTLPMKPEATSSKLPWMAAVSEEEKALAKRR